MYRFLACIFLLASFLVSCGDGGGGKDKSDSLTNKINSLVNSRVADSNCSSSAIKNMLQWYKANHVKMDSIELVTIPAPTDTSRYMVNFGYVEKYIAIVRSSGLFTERYLGKKYEYFRQCEDTLASTHQNDGPPPCLTTDLFLYTQEWEGMLEHLDSVKISVGEGRERAPKVAKLRSLWTNLIFSMKSVDGRC